MRKVFGISGILVVGVIVTALMVNTMALFSADHLDAPAISTDGAADITDIYAFRNPSANDNLVVMVNVNPFTIPGAPSMFSPDVLYQIHVDNTGDVVADAVVGVTFSEPGADQVQTFTVTGLGDPIIGQTTPAGMDANITSAGPINVFAGVRDDPFFFDLVGFQRFLAGPFVPAMGLRPAGEDPVDAFAGVNVSSIVLELPIVALTGAATSDTGVIKAWASTSRRNSAGDLQQIERMGIPAINTVLIPADQKDAFNLADPANDVAVYLATAQATIEALRGAVGAVAGFPAEDSPGVPASVLATVLIPDVVTIDFSNPVQFPNGRTLTDDVIDAAVGLILNRGNVLGGGPGVGDAINGNDVAFMSSFPWLAPPHAPVLTAMPVAELPETGDLVPEGWMIASAAVVGGLLAGVGVWVLVWRRRRVEMAV